MYKAEESGKDVILPFALSESQRKHSASFRHGRANEPQDQEAALSERKVCCAESNV